MSPLEVTIPRVPIGRWVESGIDWINDNLDGFLSAVSAGGTAVNDGLVSVLLALNPIAMIVVFALLSWLVRSWRLSLGVVVSFLLILSMNQWTQAMQTLALVLISTVVATLIAVPLGILAARSDTVSAILRPVLDLMQTMPAFVYLIPAITFFSIGVVPGLFSTIIFALPPGVRLTELGIRQVDPETVEAGRSFGATDWEILRGVQLPLAIPNIMAGINQIIMLALSMAVIAGMVGADGLGKEVVAALASINIAKGVEAGLAIVFLAVFLDRFTSALGVPAEHRSSLLSIAKKYRASRNTRVAEAA